MTDLQQPELGDVWLYPFLWSREAAHGETEGRKERPVSLLLLAYNAEGEVKGGSGNLNSRDKWIFRV